MDEWASNDAPNQWAHHWLLKSHTAILTHHSDLIRTGWDIHGRVKRNVSCRPFTETQTKHQKPEPLPPQSFSRRVYKNQLFEQQITHKSTEAWFDSIWFSCEIWLMAAGSYSSSQQKGLSSVLPGNFVLQDILSGNVTCIEFKDCAVSLKDWW